MERAVVPAMVHAPSGARWQPLSDGRSGEPASGLAGRRDPLGAARDCRPRQARTRDAFGEPRVTRAFAALLAMGALSGAASAADEFLYCTTCHGADGNGNPAIQ